MTLKYKSLTREQIEYVFNGVGSPFFFINPHDLIYKEPARRHDVLYFIGGEELDRNYADYQFGIECWRETRKQKWYKKPFYYVVTPTYIFFVKLFGSYNFEYGPPAANWEEIKARVDRDIELFEQKKRNKKWYQFWI